jgi:CheY-like chemotaxis protein
VSSWEILQQLKADPTTRPIPIIVWPGAVDDLQEKARWLAERGTATLSKPFQIDDLCETIEAVLAHRVKELKGRE